MKISITKSKIAFTLSIIFVTLSFVVKSNNFLNSINTIFDKDKVFIAKKEPEILKEENIKNRIGEILKTLKEGNDYIEKDIKNKNVLKESEEIIDISIEATESIEISIKSLKNYTNKEKDIKNSIVLRAYYRDLKTYLKKGDFESADKILKNKIRFLIKEL
ncbi:transcriptional regulator [Clostridium tetani]|uniref:Uncharacterized protein n=1 Tax=Clostridium tetani TaxID=1513 RepID=A0ABY0EQI3_CLOTA|nr:transcriptional regulator [Clostridium tetani]CDI49828.1 transcriptional regulatory protein [Clostridium tetani 12124569]KHO38755.1 hypothetical protein OR62_08925 [Clostridium tetani]RXI37494.1 hypothetical protein DP129_14090 [Clostridium tetani]RXI53791.1 hypothetical protein DP131_10725 [Clostridium tetani]RXI73402.1 hypothetical protein DQN76_01805 [Clostridium tetani]